MNQTTRIENVTGSSSFIFSALRTAALVGNKYVPDFLSGNIDVFHFVFPTVTSTRMEPNPTAFVPYFFLISSETFLSTCKNRHAPIPGNTTILDFNLYGVDAILFTQHAPKSVGHMFKYNFQSRATRRINHHGVRCGKRARLECGHATEGLLCSIHSYPITVYPSRARFKRMY